MADNADLVNVIDPDTQQVGSIPVGQLPDALNQGFTQASPEETSQFVKQEKFGTPTEQIKTGLEGAASAATFGLSTGVERALGAKPEDIEARREVNPIAHGVGQAAGLIGSSFLVPGGGAGGLFESAGLGAGKAIGLGAEAAGAEAATKAAQLAIEGGADAAAARVAGNAAKTAALREFSTGAKIGSAAVKSAAENMLFQSGDEVSKMLSSDPSQTVGTAAVNVGLSGLIGGVFGAGIGSVHPLWESTFGSKTTAALSDLSNNLEHHAENGAYTQLPGNYFQNKMLDEAVGTLKPNANEIAGAAQRLGVKPTAGTVSDIEMIQNLENNLLKRPTIAGHMLAKETDDVFKGLEKATKEVLRDATVKTEAQVGRKVKEGLVSKLNNELEPIEAKYEELKPHLQNIEIPIKMKQEAVQNILSHELAQFGGEGASRAETIAARLQKIQNLDQLKSYRTLINEQIGKAVRSGGGEELQVLYAAKNEINALRESAIEAASKATGIGAKDAEEISSKIIQDIKDTDKAYRAYKEKLVNTGREAGIGKIGNARKLLEKLKGASDESFASKIFDTGDINQLNFFKENFPEEFELARRYKLKEIAEKSIDEAQGKNGILNVGRFLRQVSDDKLGPEAKELLFAGNSQKLQDIRTMFRALPGNANPSGTAAALSHGSLFTPQGLIDNAADALKYAVLKATPRLMQAAGTTDAKATGLAAMMFLKAGQVIEAGPFKAAVDMISSVIKADNQITKSIGNVFKAGKEVIPAKALDQKDYEKLDKKLKDLQTNFNPLFESGGKVAGYMPDVGSHISQTTASAVNYLNSLRPSEDKKMPLDSKVVVNKTQQAAYHRALAIAENPLQVVSDIKEGTITPSDIVSLKTMYPGLYAKISQKLNDGIINKAHDEEPIPYKTRMGISLFLGQPLDSTMSPQSIIASQQTFQGKAQQQNEAQKQGPGPHSMKDMGKLAKSYATPQQSREAQRANRA